MFARGPRGSLQPVANRSYAIYGGDVGTAYWGIRAGFFINTIRAALAKHDFTGPCDHWRAPRRHWRLRNGDVAARHRRAAGAACRGLVMFTYIFSHFFNHALGNISYETMEAWLWFHVWWWRIPVVNYTLYTAAVIHFSLGLWALYQRRHFRYTATEITQLVLGLSIPLWLASHFGAVRLSGRCSDSPRPIMQAVLRLLGHETVYDRGAVHAADGRMDARLHRALFLAAAEAVLQLGGAHPPCHCGADAAACDDRRASRRPRGRQLGRIRNGASKI